MDFLTNKKLVLTIVENRPRYWDMYHIFQDFNYRLIPKAIFATKGECN